MASDWGPSATAYWHAELSQSSHNAMYCFTLHCVHVAQPIGPEVRSYLCVDHGPARSAGAEVSFPAWLPSVSAIVVQPQIPSSELSLCPPHDRSRSFLIGLQGGSNLNPTQCKPLVGWREKFSVTPPSLCGVSSEPLIQQQQLQLEPVHFWLSLYGTHDKSGSNIL